MKRKEMQRVIDDLIRFDALLLVVWHRNMSYPMVWLREWCGYPTSISIATAEAVRDEIAAGRLRPKPIRIRRVQRRLPAADPKSQYIETCFVN